LLARLADTEPTPPEGAFADRLGQWLQWTDAISLSSVLNGAPAKALADASPAAAAPSAASLAAEERECARLRSTLSTGLADADEATDFAGLRRRYLARQQAMEQGVGPLRARLRSRVAAVSPAMAQLAAVDEVMERTLNAQERVLLGRVPAALQTHHDRLRTAHATVQPDSADAVGEPAWLGGFRKDMQEVLLAELDHRMQPIEGLMAALRTRQSA
jgi:hypothetical protein